MNSISNQSAYDFSKSNMILTIGGQILLVVIALMVVFFGTAPLKFDANAVRNMLKSQPSNK
jgi:hypothetical protein